MEELIKSERGTGKILSVDKPVSNALYELQIYQDIIEGTEGLYSRRGQLFNCDTLYMSFEDQPLVLEMEDGRKLDIFLQPDGSFVGSGEFR